MSSPTSRPTGDPGGLLGLFEIAVCVLYGPPVLACALSATGLSGRVSRCINDRAFQAKHSPPLVDYVVILAKKPMHFGIEPFLLVHGCACMRLEPGALEDFLRYLVNEHSVLGMFFCDERHPLGRYSRAAAFSAINCNVFLWFTLAARASVQGDLSATYMWQYLFMLPTQLFLTSALNQLLRAQCILRLTPCWTCCHAISTLLVILLALLGLLWIYVFLAFLAEANATRAQTQTLIVNYMYQIVVVAGAAECFVLLRLFLNFRWKCTRSLLNLVTLNLCCCKKQSWIDERPENKPTSRHSSSTVAVSV